MRHPRGNTKEGSDMQYVYIGRNELVALLVGLITGTLYSWLNLPIPAPNVTGGICAILFTYIGYLLVHAWRKSISFGRPPARAAGNS